MNDRSDGRSENSLRPISCEFGALKNCDGSAIWKAGHTSVLAAVHGPITPRQSQHESMCGCIVSVVIKSNNAMYDPEWELFLTQQLTACIVTESYPRCIINVILQITNSDGSVLAVALHAAVSALMDASIEMNYLPTAVSCYVANGKIQLDPTNDEEQNAQSVLVLVFYPDRNDDLLLGCYTTASIQQSTKNILNCCSNASRAVPAIQAFWRLAMEKVTQESFHRSTKGLT